MGIHKVCGGKNEMWTLIPQNAPGRGGSVRLEAEPWKFLKFTCKMVTSGEF